jgi:hypothetical protein
MQNVTVTGTGWLHQMQWLIVSNADLLLFGFAFFVSGIVFNTALKIVLAGEDVD